MVLGRIYSLLGFLFFSIALMAQSGNTDYQYALIEAVKQKNLGNLPGAIELYSMVIEENDSVAVAHYELGTLLVMMGEKEKALTELVIAHQLDPENEWYFESYVDVLLMNEEFKLAEKILKRRKRELNQEVEISFKIANVYFLAGNLGKAIKVLDDIEKKYGISDKIILLKATIFEKKKDYRKALAEVDKIIDLFPESIEYHVVAAELAMNSKYPDLAVDYYLDVLQLDSMNIYAITNLTDYYRGENNIEKSFYYLNKSFTSDEIEYDKKMAILSYYLSDEKFINSYPDLWEELLLTMLNTYTDKRELRLLGTDFYIQKRKYNEALNTLLPVLVNNEKMYTLWRQGVLLANATNQTEKLYDLTSTASKIFPDSIEILFYKGIAAFELKNYSEAVNTFLDDKIENTENKEITSQSRILLAEAYFNLKEYQLSDSLFRLIISEEPTNFVVMNNYAYYLALRNESLEEAKSLSYLTIENKPKNPTFLDTYAWILYKLKDFEGAEKFIMEAMSSGGESDPDLNEHAADIHVALGSIALARAYYQKAILLGGNKENLLPKLEEISEQNEQ